MGASLGLVKIEGGILPTAAPSWQQSFAPKPASRANYKPRCAKWWVSTG